MMGLWPPSQDLYITYKENLILKMEKNGLYKVTELTSKVTLKCYIVLIGILPLFNY